MKKLVLLSIVALVFATSAQAETIFQNFASDPTLGSWTSVEDDAGSFTYKTGYSGYLMARFQGGATDSPNRYSTTLATAIDAGTEFWTEMDMKFIAETSTTTSHKSINGLYGSATDNQNVTLGNMFVYTNTTGPRYNAYARSYDSSGASSLATTVDSSGTYNGYASDYVVRLVMHNFGDGTAQLDVYDLNVDADASGTPLFSTIWQTAGNLTVNTGTDMFYWFGIGGVNSTQTTFSDVLVDNLYFSTDGRNAAAELPAFIPEPATIALLGLGALVLRRKK